MAIDHPFAGHALNAVDAKGRVSVPAAFRNTMGLRLRAAGGTPDEKGTGTLLIAPHPKRACLVVYDQVGLSKLAEELRLSVLDLPRQEQREALAELRRTELPHFVQVPFDGAGRMVLSTVLREYAHLAELAYFIGVDDYCEIWSPEGAETLFSGQPAALSMLRSYLKAREA